MKLEKTLLLQPKKNKIKKNKKKKEGFENEKLFFFFLMLSKIDGHDQGKETHNLEALNHGGEIKILVF